MKSAIVILNYNSADDCLRCVSTIKKKFCDDYFIVIVDNASKEDDVHKLKEYFIESDAVKIIYLNENRGYSAGNNVGVQYALENGAEAIMIMNPDVTVRNDILSILAKSLGPEVAWVGPRIYDLDGNNGQKIKYIYDFKRAFWDKKPNYYLGKLLGYTNAIKYDVEKEMIFSGCVSGCCFLIDANVFKDIGMFDDNVFLYAEEYILGKKLQKIGKKSCYNPEALIDHYEGKSTRKISNAFIDYHLYISEYYYLKRYADLSKAQLIIIKTIRLLALYIKSKKNKDYKKRYIQFKKKMSEIDVGDYKIVY